MTETEFVFGFASGLIEDLAMCHAAGVESASSTVLPGKDGSDDIWTFSYKKDGKTVTVSTTYDSSYKEVRGDGSEDTKQNSQGPWRP